MPRIAHLAMNVDDIDEASDFFGKVFGFTQIKIPGLRSTTRYLSDGNVHIAINQSRSGKQAAGKENERPCIDHFGIEVDNVDKYTAEASKFGCRIVSEPGKALKICDPAGITLEVIPLGTKPKTGEGG